MDVQSIISSLMKPKNVNSIAEETGEKKSTIKEVIENAVPILTEQFGKKVDNEAATKQVTAKTGLSSDTVMKIIGALAPLVIAYIGQQMTKSNDKKSTKSTKSDNPLIDMATSVFDKNKDGNVIDDLVGGLFGKK